MKLGPEDCISATVADWVRLAMVNGTFNGIAFHVANESGQGGAGHAVRLRQAKKRRIGMMPGAPDWVFSWSDGHGFIELKAAGGSLNPSQIAVRDRCERCGIRYAVCRSLEDVQAVLIEWGAITRAHRFAAA